MSRSASHVYDPPPGEEPPRAVRPQSLLVFDREGARAVDRAAVEEFGIPSIVLMENAARGLAGEAINMLNASGAVSPVVLIICGTGNNGGDGYALARHLHNHGVEVALYSLGEPRMESDAGVNLAICRKMKLAEVPAGQLNEALSDADVSLIVDAIFGTGLDRPVTGRVADVINRMNAAEKPVLAVDVPSGIDCNTGSVLGVAVHAHKTVTFVGLKVGFIGLDAQKLLGEVVVADIGAPRELLERFGKPSDLPHPEVPEHETRSHLHLHAKRPGQ